MTYHRGEYGTTEMSYGMALDLKVDWYLLKSCPNALEANRSGGRARPSATYGVVHALRRAVGRYSCAKKKAK